VLDLDQRNVHAALLLVDCLVSQRRQGEAKRTLDQMVERQPSSTAAQVAQARLLEQIGQHAEAQAKYETIVARNPDAAAAMLGLAALYVDRGEKLDVALDLVTRVRQQSPYDPAVGDVLGWVYLHKDFVTLAIPLFEDAVKSDPRNPVFRYHLGMAYLEAQDRQKARDELTHALQLDQAFPDRAKAQAALASLQK
jgi:predicted Zn-dependent protease